MLLDMYTAMVYSNATVGVFLGYAVAVFVGFFKIALLNFKFIISYGQR